MWDHIIFIWVTGSVHQTLTCVVINCTTNKGMTNGLIPLFLTYWLPGNLSRIGLGSTLVVSGKRFPPGHFVPLAYLQ